MILQLDNSYHDCSRCFDFDDYYVDNYPLRRLHVVVNVGREVLVDGCDAAALVLNSVQ